MAKRTREQILRLATEQLDHAESFATMLNADRNEAVDYYLGKRPAAMPGRSRHGSLDVFDTVEGVRSLMLEMLTSGDGIVDFKDLEQPGSDREAMARDYVDEQFYQHNPGSALLSDFLFDAAMYKVGVFNLQWTQKDCTKDIVFTNLTADELAVLTPEGETVALTEIKEKRGKDGERRWSGVLTKYYTKQCCKIRVVRPDHFLVPEMPPDVNRPNYVAERVGIYEADLHAEGLSASEIGKLPIYTLNDYRNNAALNNLTTPDVESERTGRQRREVFVAYMLADFDEINKLQIYEVRYNRNLLIDYRPVDQHNYFWWSPFRLSHKSIGLSYSDMMKGVQAHKTAIRRGVVDSVIASTNTTRYANFRQFVDPTRILNERWGEVHDVYDVDKAYREADVPKLSDATMPMLETLESEKETRSGVSRAAGGTDSNVLSHQNSHALVNEYTRAGMRRPAQQVRVMIDACLAPMMKAILFMGAEHDTKARVFRLHDTVVRYTPTEMNPDTLGLRPRLALTIQEKEEQANKLMGMHGQLSAPEGGAGDLYGPKQRYALLTQAQHLMQIPGAGQYLMDPSSEEYQAQQQAAAEQQQAMQAAQDAAAQAQQAAQTMLAEAEALKAQVAQFKAETERMLGIAEHNLEVVKAEDEMENSDDKIAIEAAKVNNENVKQLVSLSTSRNNDTGTSRTSTGTPSKERSASSVS